MRFKYIFAFIIFTFLPFVTVAQTIAVTATITDSDSQTWNNGTYSVQLSGSNYYYNGTLVSNTAQSGTLSSVGALAVTLYNTSTLTPAGTANYIWTICPNASVACSVFSTPVTTANLSSLLSSLITVPLRFPSSPTARGYLDIEVSPTPLIGTGYFNVTNNVSRIWNGTTWQNGGGGSVFSTANTYYAAANYTASPPSLVIYYNCTYYAIQASGPGTSAGVQYPPSTCVPGASNSYWGVIAAGYTLGSGNPGSITTGAGIGGLGSSVYFIGGTAGSFQVTVVTAATPAANSLMFTMNFNVPRSSGYCVFSTVYGGTSSISFSQLPLITGSSNSVLLYSGTTALAAGIYLTLNISCP